MKKDGFVEMTAKDYDMSYDTAKQIYDKVNGDLTLFYEELESYIKERARAN